MQASAGNCTPDLVLFVPFSVNRFLIDLFVKKVIPRTRTTTMLQRRYCIRKAKLFLNVLVRQMSMNKHQLLLAALAIVIAITAAAFLLREKTLPEEGEAVVELQTSSGTPLLIRAEIADSEEERRTGLMFRESLGKSEGMLFIFPDSAVRNFWMKNTLIQLDMIFIAENMTIVKIHHAVPCTSEPCPLYSSGMPAKYVLEVNANLTSAYGIREGSAAKVSLPARLTK